MTKDHKRYMVGFMRDYGYEEEALAAALDAYERIFAVPACRDIIEKLKCLYEQNGKFDFSIVLNSCTEIAEITSVNVYTANLVVLILLTESSKKRYAAENISEEIRRQNFTDLKYKCVECKLVKGIWGIFCPEWFDRFFFATRFPFGKLQFELSRFRHKFEKNGVLLLPEERVIYVHIPRTGEKLYPEDVDEACRSASAFYKQRYGLERITFVCHSWLLYPLNKEILSPDSNLYAFMSRFDIIESGEDTDYKDVWRIFDMDYKGDPDELPRDNSLRKAYYQRIKNRQPLGWGFGVWIYDRG